MKQNSQKSPISSRLRRIAGHTFMASAMLVLASTPLLLDSCASKRSVTEKADLPATTGQQQPSSQSSTAALDFVRRVSDGKVYAQNITGDLSFKLKTDAKNVSLPGALHMRKDKVIRLQLFIPLLGSEVGRLEFTPDHVLVVDRLHKRYARATYDQVPFLAANGLSFYSLQALFWNQLFLPGQQKVGESALKQFAADLGATGSTTPLTLKNGSMTYRWNADKTSARILSAVVTYASKDHGTSTLDWTYDAFRSVGVKQFPSKQTFSFATTATGKRESATVELTMSEVATDSDWEAETTLSSKYKQIDAEDLLKNLVNLE